MANKTLGCLATGIVIAAGIVASVASAEDARTQQQGMDPHQHGMQRHHHGMMDWDAMDTNHDGKISAAEHAAFAKAQFEKLDANHDGAITKDELHAHMQAMMEEHRMKMFDRIDANHDGMISKDEMEAAMHEMHGMRGMRGMSKEHMTGDDTPPPSAK